MEWESDTPTPTLTSWMSVALYGMTSKGILWGTVAGREIRLGPEITDLFPVFAEG